MEIEITKITSKGQVVIPQDIREDKKIKAGEKFLVYDLDDSIILKRIKGLKGTNTMQKFEDTFKSMWKTAKAKKLTKEDIEREIETYRKEKNA